MFYFKKLKVHCTNTVHVRTIMCWYTMYQRSKTPLYIIKVLTNKNAFINIDFCNLKLLWSGYRYAHDAHDLRNWKKKGNVYSNEREITEYLFWVMRGDNWNCCWKLPMVDVCVVTLYWRYFSPGGYAILA